MKTVLIGLLGTVLDKRGKGVKRWNAWRPTVGICMQDDLLVDRIELLDASGRVVRSEVPLSTGRTTIPVSDLTSGFYLVRVIAGETVHPAARVSVMHR